MNPYRYEVHVYPDPFLPFIVHSRFLVCRRQGLTNWHKNVEFLSCVEGQGRVRLGSEQIEFRPGDFVTVNADTPHSVVSSESVCYHCLIVDNSFFEENGISVRELNFRPVLRDERIASAMAEIIQCYESISSEKRTPFDVARFRLKVLNFLCLMCSEYATLQGEELRDNAHESVKKAMEYIRSNFFRPVSLKDVADFAGVSTYHLARLFKKYTGQSVIFTLNYIRCTEARHLIEGGKSVSEAALSCGFENLSYFSRLFRRYFDRAPSDCKKENGA